MTTPLRRPRGGSTAAWRRLRRFILERDRYTCQVPLPPDGRLCGQPATDAGHIVAYILGGTDHPDNLRSECSACSKRGGGRIRHLLKGTP